MGTSAKRLGTSDEASIDSRFRRIENELQLRALSNQQSGTSAVGRSRAKPTVLTGISLDTGIVGGIGIRWNRASVGDVSGYEVLVANNRAFVGARRFIRQENNLTFSEGSPDDEYFVKVRAVNSRKEPGEYTPVLSTKTGKAQYSNLEAGAATNPSEDRVVDFTPAVLSADGDEGIYGSAQVVATANEIVLPFVIFRFSFESVYGGGNNRVTLTLQRNGEDLPGAVPMDVFSDIGPPAAETAITGLSVPDTPGVGTFTYSVKMTISKAGGNTLTITPIQLDMEMVGLRQGG
jgi:hypothetical protein